MSSPRRSHRRHTPDEEQSFGSALEEVLELGEEHAVAPPDDSHATMPYYSPHESRSHGSTSAGDASSAALDEPRTDVVRKTPQDTSTTTVVEATIAHASVVPTLVAQTPVAQPTIVYIPVVQAPIGHTPVPQPPIVPVVQAPVARTPVPQPPIVPVVQAAVANAPVPQPHTAPVVQAPVAHAPVPQPPTIRTSSAGTKCAHQFRNLSHTHPLCRRQISTHQFHNHLPYTPVVQAPVAHAPDVQVPVEPAPITTTPDVQAPAIHTPVGQPSVTQVLEVQAHTRDNCVQCAFVDAST
jgi:hypothetical protein